MALVLRSSPIHSRGVFTTTPIRKGKRLVEYAGPRYTRAEAFRVFENRPQTYLYIMEDGNTVIDGKNLGAFANHSCDPNCEVDEVQGRVWIYALRNIAAGEELLWDYNLFEDDDPQPCHCGSPNCRGTMYSPEWMAKLRRRKRLKKSRARKIRQTRQKR